MNTPQSTSLLDSPQYVVFEELMDCGEYAKALEQALLLQTEYPLSPTPFVLCGDIYSAMEKWADSHTYYQKALEKESRVWVEPDPEGYRTSAMFALDCASAVYGAYYGCGICLLHMARYSEAVTHFKMCLNQGPDDSEIHELIEYTKSLMIE